MVLSQDEQAYHQDMKKLAKYIAPRFARMVLVDPEVREFSTNRWKDRVGLIRLITTHTRVSESTISSHLSHMLRGYSFCYLPKWNDDSEFERRLLRRTSLALRFANKDQEYDAEVAEIVTRVREDFSDFVYPPELRK
tara:strand:- start:1532 stop:1942 length:411 start_codon:yes stop_codon:yes gene_type:complete